MSAWKWKPDRSGWYAAAKKDIENWHLHPSLNTDEARLKEILLNACNSSSEWLFHPSIRAIFSSVSSPQCDFQMILWVSLNTHEFTGKVVLKERLYAWGPNGSKIIKPGAYDFSEITDSLFAKKESGKINFDLWGDSYGAANGSQDQYNKFGFKRDHTTEANLLELRGKIVQFFNTLQFYEQHFPEAFHWINTVTKVVCPFSSLDPRRFRSSSVNVIPGIIWTDIHGGDLQVIESLVHESAHQYLFVEEANSPLIRDGDQPIYSSPLRKDLRPLRGILLAFHALAFMSFAYYEIANYMSSKNVAHSLEDLLTRCKDAQSTLYENKKMLTKKGELFFEKTNEIIDVVKI